MKKKQNEFSFVLALRCEKINYIVIVHNKTFIDAFIEGMDFFDSGLEEEISY